MINLSKIGWQNGTLISKAKVEIGGQIYEVEPEEYSGTTPMSAENLKQMENNIEEAINEVDEKISKASDINVSSLKLNSNIIQSFIPQQATSYEIYGGCYYYKIGTKVHVHLGISMSDTATKNIYTLPQGYRPYSRVGNSGCGSNVQNTGGIQIDTDGIIKAGSLEGYVLVDIEYDAFN